MRLKFSALFLSLHIIIFFSNGFAQTKSQNVIAASLEQGEYMAFVSSEYGIFIPVGKKKVSIELNSENLATSINIDNTAFEVWSKDGSDWSSGFSYLNEEQCIWIPDSGESIVVYELDGKSNTVNKILAYFGKKPGKTKAVKKMIDAYLVLGLQKMEGEKEALAQAKLDHKNKYSIAGKAITDLKLEIISDDKTLDCGSVFQVGITATTSEGNTIKSYNLGGEFYAEDFDVNVSGAKKTKVKINGGKNATYKYTVQPYCESFENKTLKVTVVAKDNTQKSKSFETKVNCKPDPAVIAAAAKAEQRKKDLAAAEKRKKEQLAIDKKKRDEYLLAEKKRREEEAKNPSPKPDVTSNNQGAGKRAQVISVTPDFMYMPNKQLEIMGGFMGENKYSFVGGQKNRSLDYTGYILTFGELGLGLETANKNTTSTGTTGRHIYAGDETENGDMLLGIKTSILLVDGNYGVLKKHNDQELFFIAVQDLGNGKCAALASTDSYYMKLNHMVTREELKLVIWDYKEGKATTIDISSGSVSAMPQLIKTTDGNIIIAYDEYDRANMSLVEFSYLTAYFSAKTKIYKVDPIKSFATKKLNTIWTYEPSVLNRAELSDLIEARNGDIVFVSKGNSERHTSPGNNRNFHSAIHMASLNANGTDFKHIKYDYLGYNKVQGVYTKPKHSKYVYMGALGKPFLIENPKGPGFIVVHRPALDMLEHTVDKGEERFADIPAFIMHNTETLKPETMSYLNVFYKTPEKKDYRKYSTSPFNGEKFQIKDVQYHPGSDKFILIEEELAVTQEGENASRREGYNSEIGEISMWVIDYSNYDIADPGPDVATDGSFVVASNSGGGGSSNSSNSETDEPTAKLVQVYVDPNRKETVKIYWKQDGSNKTFTLTGSRRAIGYLPEGTKLSYAVGPDYNKKNYFYTVPSGKSSVSVDL